MSGPRPVGIAPRSFSRAPVGYLLAAIVVSLLAVAAAVVTVPHAGKAAGLHHTIVRPGRLSDADGTGRVRVDRHLPSGEITRDDVAVVLAAVLREPGTIRRTFEVVGGDTPVPEAVAAVEALIPPDD